MLILIVSAFARIADNIDLTTLAYVALAIGLLYIDDFQEISFGDKGFSFKRRAERVASEFGVGGKPDPSAISQRSHGPPEAGVVASA